MVRQLGSECKNKWVVFDQGGELYGNPDVRNLFKQYQYEIPLVLILPPKMVLLNELTVLSSMVSKVA